MDSPQSSTTSHDISRFSSSIFFQESFPRTNSLEIEHLVEYKYILKDEKISHTTLLVLSLYSLYKKRRVLKIFLKSVNPPFREYVQASHMHPIHFYLQLKSNMNICPFKRSYKIFKNLIRPFPPTSMFI